MIPIPNLAPKWKNSFQRLVLPMLAAVFASLLWITPAQATGVYEIPDLTAGESTWIVDQADIVSRINKANLNRTLETLAEETGNEVRLVTIHRFDYGENAQSFVDQLFEKWFPTPEAQANQTVLVIDNVTNDAAIRVGEQSQTLLSDDIANSVVQETLMVPLRRDNKYNQGLLDVSDRLTAVLSGQPDPGPPAVEKTVQVEGTFTSAEDTDDSSATVAVVVLLLLATVIPMATYYLYQVIQS